MFVAGENGPELIVGKQGSTVFPTEETDKIIDALNGMEPASDTSNEKKFDQFLQALTGVTVDAPEPGPGESLFDSVLGKVADIVSGKNSDLEAMAIPFPREAKELLFIVQKPKGEENNRDSDYGSSVRRGDSLRL